jgi:hypothetical protein
LGTALDIIVDGPTIPAVVAGKKLIWEKSHAQRK